MVYLETSVYDHFWWIKQDNAILNIKKQHYALKTTTKSLAGGGLVRKSARQFKVIDCTSACTDRTPVCLVYTVIF